MLRSFTIRPCSKEIKFKSFNRLNKPLAPWENSDHLLFKPFNQPNVYRFCYKKKSIKFQIIIKIKKMLLCIFSSESLVGTKKPKKMTLNPILHYLSLIF